MDMKKSFEGNTSRALQKLAVDIIPDNEALKDAKICIHKVSFKLSALCHCLIKCIFKQVVRLLQRKSSFKIGQVCIAGSAGKKTTICNSDVDCVLFINEQLPPFKDVLEDFKNILSVTDLFQLSDLSITQCSIQFRLNNFDFDILPAANFVSNYCQEVNSNVLDDVQQKETLDHIKRDPAKFGYLYSGSLARSTIKFMKRQDGFINEMVRISKFWYKTLHFNEKISGAKSLIEFIAVFTAIKELNYDSLSYLRCFTQVVNYLQNFDQLDIVFEKEYKFPEHQILDNSRPRVMDPVNPYNNLAKNWTKNSIELMKLYANETYRRLECLAHENIIRMDFLFDPQPTRLQIYQTSNHIIKKPVEWKNEKHNNVDVTFEVPISNEESIHVTYRL